MKARFLDGWPLLGLLSLLLIAMIVICLASYGGDVTGVRAAIRLTARTSLILFALAFSARAMVTLWPCGLTQWQRRNRRQLGLSFAVSHILHAAAVVAFARMDPAGFRDHVMPATLVSGGIAYVFILAMAATSFDRVVAWMGPSSWWALHWRGGYYLWLSFIVTNGKRIGQSPLYGLPVALMLLILVLRIVARRRGRSLPTFASAP